MSDDRATNSSTRLGDLMAQPRIVIAPDSYKGTLTAIEVAEAIAQGVATAGGIPVTCPLSDGGEGLTSVMSRILGGRRQRAIVAGPLNTDIVAEYLITPDGRTAIMDAASVCGLPLIEPTPRNAELASSAGVGQLLIEAVRSGVSDVLLGVGGTSCTDGGAAAINEVRVRGGLGGMRVRVLCDVATRFEHAATTYAPQKGADPETVTLLERRLVDLANLLPRDPRGLPMTGAGGGLSGGLWAAFDAQLLKGIDTVLDLVNFDGLLAGADAVITGEGRIDGQTIDGKLVSGLSRRTAAAGIPLYAFVGTCAIGAHDIARLGLREVVEAGTPALLSAAARSLTHRLAGNANALPKYR